MLPTEVYVLAREINGRWYEMDEDDQVEAISDYLSDEYGFCHKGFEYEETKAHIRITNIRWDIDDDDDELLNDLHLEQLEQM